MLNAYVSLTVLANNWLKEVLEGALVLRQRPLQGPTHHQVYIYIYIYISL